MPQRLPKVRMFNLGLLEEVYIIRYYWYTGKVEIKARVRGKNCLLDLGLKKAQKVVLFVSPDEGIKFIDHLASFLFRVNDKLFDIVHVEAEECTVWFPSK